MEYHTPSPVEQFPDQALQAQLFNRLWGRPPNYLVSSQDSGLLRAEVAAGHITDHTIQNLVTKLPLPRNTIYKVHNLLAGRFDDKHPASFYRLSLLSNILRGGPDDYKSMFHAPDAYAEQFQHTGYLTNPFGFLREINRYLTKHTALMEQSEQQIAHDMLYDFGREICGDERWETAVAWETLKASVAEEIRRKQEMAKTGENERMKERIERLGEYLRTYGAGVVYGTPGHKSGAQGTGYQIVTSFALNQQLYDRASEVKFFIPTMAQDYRQVKNTNGPDTHGSIPSPWRRAQRTDIGSGNIRDEQDFNDSYEAGGRYLTERQIVTIKPYDPYQQVKTSGKGKRQTTEAMQWNPFHLPNLTSQTWMQMEYFVPVYDGGRPGSCYMDYMFLFPKQIPSANGSGAINLEQEIDALFPSNLSFPDILVRYMFPRVFEYYNVEPAVEPKELLYRDWRTMPRDAFGKLFKLSPAK